CLPSLVLHLACHLLWHFALSSSFFFRSRSGILPHLLSFPTRRSSDLVRDAEQPLRLLPALCRVRRIAGERPRTAGGSEHDTLSGDRKSTRLNSSHVSISYAVFCLKKKIQVSVR